MNFLAHIFLSGDFSDLTAGNFIGDFVKGNQSSAYSQEIQKGISLHREIDQFTDNHAIVLESKKRLRDRFRHYAPVIVDIFYDHFLASNWKNYSNEGLETYTLRFYDFINNYKNIIPHQVNEMLFYMEKDNWLYQYRTIEGIRKALEGMSRRTKFDSKMEQAPISLQEDYDSFKNEFNRFFPMLQNHVKQYIS